MPLRTCIGCGVDITTGSRCHACKPERQRNGWRWSATRSEHLARHPTCVICHTAGTAGNPLEVHHLDDNPDNNRPSNLQTRCKTHHNDVTYPTRART